MSTPNDLDAVAAGRTGAIAAVRQAFGDATADERKLMLDELTRTASNRHCRDLLLTLLR